MTHAINMVALDLGRIQALRDRCDYTKEIVERLSVVIPEKYHGIITPFKELLLPELEQFSVGVLNVATAKAALTPPIEVPQMGISNWDQINEILLEAAVMGWPSASDGQELILRMVRGALDPLRWDIRIIANVIEPHAPNPEDFGDLVYPVGLAMIEDTKMSPVIATMIDVVLVHKVKPALKDVPDVQRDIEELVSWLSASDFTKRDVTVPRDTKELLREVLRKGYVMTPDMARAFLKHIRATLEAWSFNAV